MDKQRAEGIASSIVREYLSRKGLKGTLQSMDEEMPRADNCISNRQLLMKELHIEKLMKKNKEMLDPLRAMIEVIVRFLLERADGDRPVTSKIDMNPAADQHSPGTEKLEFKFSNEAMAASSSKRRTSASTASSITPVRTESGDLVIEDNLDSETVLGDGKSGLLALESSEYSPSTTKSRPRSSNKHRGLSGPVISNLDERRKLQRPRPLTGGSRKGGILGNSATSTDSTKDREMASVTTSNKEASTVTASNKTPLLVTPKSELDDVDNLLSRPAENRKSIQNIIDISESLKGTKVSSSRRQNSVEESQYSVDKSSVSKRPSTRDGVSQRPTVKSSTTKVKVGDVEIGDVDDLDNEVANLDLGPRLPIGRPIQNLVDARPINLQTAVNLKTILFGTANQNFNDEWRYQSFTFCDLPGIRYGIVQKKGGPCGVLAAVQAVVLQEMLFCASKQLNNKFGDVSIEERSGSLAAALARILWRAGENKTAVVVLPSGKPQFQTGKGKFKQDDLTETLMINHFKSHEDLKNFITQNLSQFELDGTCGVILALYSCILSRFIDLVRSDMDEPSGKLMGAHGYCTQDMVNLILTGRAVSNVFNDVMELESGDDCPSTILKGPNCRSDLGLLSLFEHFRSCQVGTYLKTPRYPIWVVCSESHFSVMFSVKKELMSNWKAERRFDLYYYDGLARQQEPIKLTVDTTVKYEGGEEDLVPPLEHCIRTKWRGAVVDWNGTEPLL